MPLPSHLKAMIHRTDYHIHSRFSDGRSDPEDYLPQAIAAGLSEIGFSDHLTLFKDPQDWNMNPGNVTTYIHYSIILAVISYLAGLLGFWFGKKGICNQALTNILKHAIMT